MILSMLLPITMSLLMYTMRWTKISLLLGGLQHKMVFLKPLDFLNCKFFDTNVCNRSGIQMRRNSWQDGVLGTNCPIPPSWNWTYNFQVKDQIGSFFYFPALNFQRASGGFGSFHLNNREIIPIPFATPDGDIAIMIGDWYTRNHTVSICCCVGIFM